MNIRERFTVDLSDDVLLGELDELKDRASNIDFPDASSRLDSGENIERIVSETLEEQSQIEDNSFNKYQELQNIRITGIENKLEDLEKHYGDFKKPQAKVRSIKSYNNGMKMSVVPLSDNRHLVRVNNGCLSCDSVGNYNVVPCAVSDVEQQFELHEIHNQTYYNSNLEPGVPKLNNQNNQTNKNIKYPFYLARSVTSGNCLQNNHTKISVQPCNVKTSQRWSSLEGNNVCS